MNSTRFRVRCVTGLIAMALIASGRTAIADQVWDKVGEFIVRTDFKYDFKMRKGGKVYFKTVGQQDVAMKDVVGTRLSLTGPDEAEYELHIRTEKRMNYAVRNDERLPAEAFVMFSICEINVTDMKDCQNTQFFSFDYKGGFVFFNKAFDLWLQRVQGP